VTTGHLVPRLCSAGAHSTLHGVVFAFLCLDTCGVPPKGICTASGAAHPALVYARSKGASRKTDIRLRPKNRCEKPAFAVLTAASRSPRAVLGA